jgi:hypothetical protein
MEIEGKMRFLSVSEYKMLVYLIAKVAKQSLNQHEHHGDDLEIPARQFFRDVARDMDLLDCFGSKWDGN